MKERGLEDEKGDMRGKKKRGEEKVEGLEIEMKKEKDMEKTRGEGTQKGKGRVKEEDEVCFVKRHRGNNVQRE